MPKPTVAAACLALALGTSLSIAAPDSTRFESRAVDQESGKPLYRESHVERTEGGKPLSLHTRFLRMDGEAFAERTLDFSATPFTPVYRFEDFRTGWQEGAAKEKDGYRVYCRKGKGKPRKEKLLKVPEPVVIDGGFNAFLKHHRAALVRGERLKFQFVVPSRMAWYRFEAYLDKERSGKGPEGPLAFVAVPRNKALRLLAPRVQVTYDPASGRMIGYEGISNLAADGGGAWYIRLAYSGGGP